MESVFKADWYELTLVGIFVSAGWYIGNEAVRVAWKMVWDLGMQAWGKMKPDA